MVETTNSKDSDLSILIINWKREDLTSALLRDLAPQLRTEAVEVLILDNEASEAPPRWWGQMPGVSVFSSPTNLGYSGGMSFLIERSVSPYCWLLNNDCRAPDDALRVVRAAIQDGSSDILLPLIKNPDGSLQSRDCRWSRLLGWRTGDPPQLDRGSYRIFGDLFVAPIVRRDLVHSLKLFPPQFHTYGEDFDACYAVAASGCRVARECGITLVHAKSSSRPAEPAIRYRYEVQGVRNVLTSVLLNYSRHTILWAAPALFGKMLLHQLLWRWRRELFACPALLLTWLKLPFAVAKLTLELQEVRRARLAARRLSDRAVALGP